MTSRDEALRALEKEFRDMGAKSDTFEAGYTFSYCADELAAILSDRQELAPVAWPLASEGEKKIGWTLDYKFIESVEKRARELDYEEAPSLEGVELVLRAVADIYASPAQTSEARDAETIAIATAFRIWEGQTAFWRGQRNARLWIREKAKELVGAMRQEGGQP